MENGADLRLIQELLGHARLDTTQIYPSVAITQIREVHACCHPRGRVQTRTDLPPGTNPAT